MVKVSQKTKPKTNPRMINPTRGCAAQRSRRSVRLICPIFGCVTAARVILPIHDVAGAKAVGMTTVLIEERHGRSPLDVGDAEPDHTIGALPELLPVLDEIGVAAP